MDSLVWQMFTSVTRRDHPLVDMIMARLLTAEEMDTPNDIVQCYTNGATRKQCNM